MSDLNDDGSYKPFVPQAWVDLQNERNQLELEVQRLTEQCRTTSAKIAELEALIQAVRPTIETVIKVTWSKLKPLYEDLVRLGLS
jgi:hypothetical protein